MAGASYNITRFTRQVLKRHRKEPPSLVLHLYPTHFRFEQQVRLARCRSPASRSLTFRLHPAAWQLQLRLAYEVLPRSYPGTEAAYGSAGRPGRGGHPLLRG